MSVTDDLIEIQVEGNRIIRPADQNNIENETIISIHSQRRNTKRSIVVHRHRTHRIIGYLIIPCDRILK